MSGFDRLKGAAGGGGSGRGPGRLAGSGEDGEFLQDLPPDMPAPPVRHPKWGVPAGVWIYRNHEGRPLYASVAI